MVKNTEPFYWKKNKKANGRTFVTHLQQDSVLQNEQEADSSAEKEQDIFTEKEPISIATLKVSMFSAIYSIR